MGVRRLFSRGGRNFPGGGKNILFASKSLKHTFWPAMGGPGKGASTPSCPPLRTPMQLG